MSRPVSLWLWLCTQLLQSRLVCFLHYRTSALMLSGKLFQFSTVLTAKECFLMSVLAYWETRPFTPAFESLLRHCSESRSEQLGQFKKIVNRTNVHTVDVRTKTPHCVIQLYSTYIRPWTEIKFVQLNFLQVVNKLCGTSRFRKSIFSDTFKL